MPIIADSTRSEEITEYEAQCLRAAFLVGSEEGDRLSPPTSQPVGRGLPVTQWDLIDRLLRRLRTLA